MVYILKYLFKYHVNYISVFNSCNLSDYSTVLTICILVNNCHCNSLISNDNIKDDVYLYSCFLFLQSTDGKIKIYCGDMLDFSV